MILALQTFALSAAVTLLFTALGYGWTRWLLPASPALFYAPWLGLVQTGFILIFCGFLDIGTNTSCWAALALGIGAAVFILARERRISVSRSDVAACAFVALFTAAVIFPFLQRAGGWTSFTIGNNDIYDYVSTARHLQERGLRRYLAQFGHTPEWPNPTMHERAAGWQIPSMRWLSYYDLAFVASLFRVDPVSLYSLFITFLYAAFVPLIWLLARDTLSPWGKGAWLAGALVLLNPHVYYVLFNVFLPQMAATGFLVAFLAVVAGAARAPFSWKAACAAGLLAAGLCASYIEMFPFLGLAFALYLASLAAARELAARDLARWLAAVAIICVALCPYHVFHFVATFFFHAGDKGGGWNVTDRYYLFPFQLGLFFSHPHQPKPAAALEWALNPVLLALMAAGLAGRREWKFYAALAVPFLVTGWISFANDWNYRYFKNFTYVYFVAPLLLGAGVDALERWKTAGGAPLRWAVWLSASLLVGAIAAAALSKTFESWRSSVRNASRVPARFSALEGAIPAGAGVVHLDGVGFWESLWASYYLGRHSVVMSEENPYLRNDRAALEDSPAETLVLPNGFDLSSYPHAARARISGAPAQAGDFLIYSLSKAQ